MRNRPFTLAYGVMLSQGHLNLQGLWSERWESNPSPIVAFQRNEITRIKGAWYTQRYTVALSKTYLQ
jgi:hypothetical protein